MARRRQGFALAGALLILAAVLAGCGSSRPAAFAWLQPGSTPPGWHVARISSGAQLSYPPAWKRLPGDAGTATAAQLSPGGVFLGYLNVTPRQGDETLPGWATFRVVHNAKEGDRNVRRLAAATGLRFANGRGSCVRDSYVTFTGAHFTEIACLVKGPTGSSVVVGAARPNASGWGLIEQAISAFRA
jgi:hypothetical protein